MSESQLNGRQPGLSLVTICFNNTEELRQTLHSVDSQSRKPDEHWIIDGSNNNEIKNWLERNPQPPYRKVLSESDEGISDALNKGVERAQYDVVHLLHSADEYFDAYVIEKVMREFEIDKELMWTHGKYRQYVGGQWLVTGAPFDPAKIHLGMRKVSHPTMFVRKEVYDRHGMFRKDKKLAMDYDFLIRIRHEKFKFLDFGICIFAPDGASNQHWSAAYQEVMDSYREHIGSNWKLYIGWLKQQLFYRLLHLPPVKWILKLKYRNNG